MPSIHPMPSPFLAARGSGLELVAEDGAPLQQMAGCMARGDIHLGFPSLVSTCPVKAGLVASVDNRIDTHIMPHTGHNYIHRPLVKAWLIDSPEFQDPHPLGSNVDDGRSESSWLCLGMVGIL